MKIVVAADHAGYVLKDLIADVLRKDGHEITDLGVHEAASVDYPDLAHAASVHILEGKSTLGILVCGTGQGMAMAANRHPGIRAAVCGDSFSARATRTHNEANVLCLGARVTGAGLAVDLARIFVEATFEGGRHAGRVAKIEPR